MAGIVVGLLVVLLAALILWRVSADMNKRMPDWDDEWAEDDEKSG
jgi:hypothetical protein